MHPPYTLANSVVLLSNLKDLTTHENLPSALLKDRYVCPVEWFLECLDTHRNQLYRKMSVTQFGIAQFTQTKSPPFSSAQTNVSAFYHQPTPHSGCRGNCPNFISTPPPHPHHPNALLSLYSSLHFPWKSFMTENISMATSFNREIQVSFWGG